ncbi:hypothetical protein [Microvirga yunnanensis]|uniref:hypothetical protein n=1 Tax=Microvirga yunnanensis TaxID=2953740 RepID=UPI0035A00DB8
MVGNAELLQRRLPEGFDRLHRAADQTMQAAQRAATLTQRLLAFSRRQPLDPSPSTQTSWWRACPICCGAPLVKRLCWKWSLRGICGGPRPTRASWRMPSSTWRRMRATPCRRAAS